MKEKEKNLVERIISPTPKFFQKLRNIGLILGAASAVILGSPVALPAAVVTTAGYLAVAGGVITAVSQTAVQDEEKPVSKVK